MKNRIYILSILALLITLSSCFKDDPFDAKAFDGLLIEFDYAAEADRNFDDPEIIVNDGSGLLDVQVNLIGVQQTVSQTIGFVIADTSTAVEGKHYSLSGNSFVLPASTSDVNIPVDILDSSLSDDPIASGESRYLVLVLEGNDAIGVSENYKSQVIYIEN